MIALLTGRLLHKSTGSVIVDAGGVGYEAHIPLSSFYALPDPGAAVTLHIHTYVREDALQLFGFLTQREKELFLALISVSGVGPKLALGVISGLPPDVLVDAIIRGDERKVATIPGIGPKTAARLVLELRDKVRGLASQMAEASSAPAAGDAHEAVSAMVNLGYKKNLAEDAVKKVVKDGAASLEGIIKAALKAMAR